MMMARVSQLLFFSLCTPDTSKKLKLNDQIKLIISHYKVTGECSVSLFFQTSNYLGRQNFSQKVNYGFPFTDPWLSSEQVTIIQNLNPHISILVSQELGQ